MAGEPDTRQRSGSIETTTRIVAYVHPEIAPLRNMVAAARSRLAEIETNYTRDRCAVEATQAKLFNLVREHYQKRDRLRLMVDHRRRYRGPSRERRRGSSSRHRGLCESESAVGLELRGGGKSGHEQKRTEQRRRNRTQDAVEKTCSSLSSGSLCGRGGYRRHLREANERNQSRQGGRRLRTST